MPYDWKPFSSPAVLYLDAFSNTGSGNTCLMMTAASRASRCSTPPPRASMMPRSVLRPSVYRYHVLAAKCPSIGEVEKIYMYIPSPQATDPSVNMLPMETSRLRRCARFLLLILPVAVGAVTNAAPAPYDGKALYGPCVVCHQPNAWGSPDGRIPSLAGQTDGYLANQFASFRSGTWIGTAMHVVSADSRFDDPSDISRLSEPGAAPDPKKKVAGSKLYDAVPQR